MNRMQLLIGMACSMCVPSLTSGLLAKETFQPDGTWTIQSHDSCSGSSTYSRLPSAKPISVKGGDFVCSSYLKENKLPKRDELHLQYLSNAHAVQVTGGPSMFPRTIPLDKDNVGVSSTKLFPKTTQQSLECDMMSYDLETVKFTNSNQMLYGFVTVYEFIPRKNRGCDSYLASLKTAIQRRTATGVLLAMRDAHAVSVDQMRNLRAINVFENYIGVRKTLG